MTCCFRVTQYRLGIIYSRINDLAVRPRFVRCILKQHRINTII